MSATSDRSSGSVAIISGRVGPLHACHVDASAVPSAAAGARKIPGITSQIV
ncbi:hypothetical protein OAO87_04225 [bacterium]|nr:hypothetical protein [bacterium]